MAKKVDFWTVDTPDSPVIDCEGFIAKLAQARISDESPELSADEICMLRVLTAEELRQSVEDAVRASRLVPRGKDMLPLRHGLLPRGELQPFHNLYFEKEPFLSHARKAWLIEPNDGSATPSNADGITIAALGWMIATQRPSENGEYKPSTVDDDGLRRTIEIAMRLHGWPNDNITGVIPQISALADAGHITVRGDGDTAKPDVAAISAKPSAYWLTLEDAQHVLTSLCPPVRRYSLTEAAELIAMRVHHDDHIAEYALKTSLTTDMRKAVEHGELPESERRRDGEIMLNEYAVDEWLARERRPHRLGVARQVRLEQREMMRAGRLHIQTVADRLAKRTGIDAPRWESTLIDAIRTGTLPLKNPRNLADSLPYAVPKNLRAFYDRVQVVDVNALLDANPSWQVSYRFRVWPAKGVLQFTEARAGAPIVTNALISSDDVGLSKRERQIRAIEAAADAKGFPRKAIPDGGKKTLREYCKSNHADLFGAGDSPFDDAWKDASPKRLAMANRAKYAGR